LNSMHKIIHIEKPIIMYKANAKDTLIIGL
jgi:hypothetical protein